MKKNNLFEELKKSVPLEVKKQVDLSFAIVDRICDIMEEQGLSQKDLATKMGKTEAEISKWMRGTHNFTIATITKLETVLGEDILNVTKKVSLTKKTEVQPLLSITYNLNYNSSVITSAPGNCQKEFGSSFASHYLN